MQSFEIKLKKIDNYEILHHHRQSHQPKTPQSMSIIRAIIIKSQIFSARIADFFSKNRRFFIPLRPQNK